jgi:hypothetical protein
MTTLIRLLPIFGASLFAGAMGLIVAVSALFSPQATGLFAACSALFTVGILGFSVCYVMACDEWRLRELEQRLREAESAIEGKDVQNQTDR